MRIFMWKILFLLGPMTLCAQSESQVKWHNVRDLPLQGQVAMAGTAHPFQRLPDSLKNRVRDRVWELSRNPAGIQFQFSTDARKIFLRYQVRGERSFPHMPETGVSGLDLYTRKEGQWAWLKGRYRFSDTISYTYTISTGKHSPNYLLYLPLYAELEWLQIGVAENKGIDPSSGSDDKPIVIYGTSITQGACASRPGNAWTNILGRKIGQPVLNFGFSGNGRLEPEIIDYLTRLKAQAFVFDCLANFTSGQGLGPDHVYERVVEAVRKVRELNPGVPIVLVDHAGYPGGEVYAPDKRLFQELNQENQRAFEDLRNQGVKHLYLLSFEELGLTAEDFVDGVHPTDRGMIKYAQAYERLFRRIFQERP